MIFLFYVVIFQWSVYGTSKMPIQMMEETPVNTEIGNILSHIPDNIPSSQFQYVSDRQFFSVTNGGKLVVQKSIDLETLCLQFKLCCGLPICVIEANILVSNNEKEIIVNIELQVRVLDKNDHKPSFSALEQSVQISEFSPIGVSISIQSASDGDATQENRIQNYRLTDPSASFNLDLSRLPSIAIMVRKQLDFEEKNRFEATLEACDPDICSTQKVIINIKDENDNQPLFEHEIYNITIKEDVGVGTSIGQVKAFDRDSGKYGEIRYSISVDSDLDLKSTFVIESRSGQIQLRKKLSTNTRDYYRLSVVARDADPLNPKQAMCQVTIKIEDMNDHKPVITVVHSVGPLNISENVGPRYVTSLKISDYDQGKNAIVQCRLDINCESSFELISNSKNVYSLKTVRQFDHEQEQKVDAIIICKDLGEPSLESVKVIPVYVTDVNEYMPYFKTTFYKLSVAENSPKGTKIATIAAYDRDKSALLTYQIDNYGSEFFLIDSGTGEITFTNKELDRERTPSVSFTIHVTDSATDPKTVSVQVKITILDVNDNSPVFPPYLPQFSVIENTQPTRLNGQLTAKDDDQDENALITFSLINTWNGHGTIREETLFHVISSGYIETLTPLDREKCDYYILEVMASDSARTPQSPLSTKVNVTVRVLDENDNAPIWMNPDMNVYNISDAMKPGDHLTQLRARDVDVGVNGKIRFGIVAQYRQEIGPPRSGGNFFHYFTLNTSSGHLVISQILHSGTVIVRLRASDHGQPVRSSEVRFVINISGDESANLNMTIIAVMITVTAFISLFLIVAIICVRRKPPKYHSPTSSIVTKDQPVPDWIGLHPSDESLMAYETGNKAPYVANTVRPASAANSHEGTLQMHTFTQNCQSYEPIDGDSGDSGRGPSEEGSNSQHPLQEGSNYYSLRQPVRGTFRSCVPNPTSPIRSTCHCYVLPEESIIQPGYSGSFHVYSQCGKAMPSPSALPTCYNSFTLPRHQYHTSRQRIIPNSGNQFHVYNTTENSFISPHQMHNVNDYQTSKIYSRLTPMHIRRVSEIDSCCPPGDDKASSLVTSTTSASSSTKTVLYNGPLLSSDASAISLISSRADVVES